MHPKKKAIIGLSLEQIIIIICLIIFLIIFFPIFMNMMFNTESTMSSWSEGILESFSG
ncbi:MAG: hypothetical protein KAQ92_04910 [Candidatus Aenigmarchaeota archaeon]|nr:hypothetical protein [Candidatus Aenigmarchaeota archaeon]